ncbi:Nuclear actin-protein involved in chromatin remodeling [Sorochytrium milnesiophthora]
MLPIAIDNGSWHCRAGFSNADMPTLDFESLVSRYKDRKAGEYVVCVGDGVNVDNMTRSVGKSPFDGDVLVNSELAECVFDYVFANLGVASLSEHPLVVTETYCNPPYSRNMLCELLFECYDVPKLSLGVDSLFSYQYNMHRHGDTSDAGVVVSSGHRSTHVIPILNGMPVHEHARRLNWGGAQSEELLLKLFQLKYPTFPTRMTAQDAQVILHDHCMVAEEDYQSFLHDVRYNLDLDRVVQYPVQNQAESPTTPTEQEAHDQAQVQARREQQRQRFVEMAAQRREEKLREKEEYLVWLKQLRDRRDEPLPDAGEDDDDAPEAKAARQQKQYERMLEQEGIDNYKELLKMIKDIEKKVQISKARAAVKAGDAGAEAILEAAAAAPEPSFPLLDIPDDQLDAETLKQKRMQRLHKAQYEQRKARQEAARVAEQARAQAQAEEEALRISDPDQWLQRVRAKRDDVKSKLQAIRQRKEEASKRKGAASMQRMRVLAELAGNGDEERGGDAAAGGSRRKRKKDEDTFGMNDSDWQVYQSISKDGGANDDDNDGEEDEETRLQQDLAGIDDQLVQHDPTFVPDHVLQQLETRRTVLHRLRYGPVEAEPDSDVQVQHQVRVNVERCGVPEAMWQPHAIAGVDQAGLSEIVESVLRQFSREQRLAMAKNVFVTGSHTGLLQFDKRLQHDMRAAQPVDGVVRVWSADNRMLDGWRGAAHWANNSSGEGNGWMTRQDYAEHGSERLSRVVFAMSP